MYMSNLSIDIKDDVLAGLLVTANEKNTTLEKLVNTIIVEYIKNHDEELLAAETITDPQLLVERQALEARDHWTVPADSTKECCGGEVARGQQDPVRPEPGNDWSPPVEEAPVDEAPVNEAPVPNGGDLEGASIFNKPITKKPPQGVPLYNKRVTNKWL
jgi:hypothetical protein